MNKNFLILFTIFFGILIVIAGEIIGCLLIGDSLCRMYFTAVYCFGVNCIIYLIAHHIEKKEIAEYLEKKENEKKH